MFVGNIEQVDSLDRRYPGSEGQVYWLFYSSLFLLYTLLNSLFNPEIEVPSAFLQEITLPNCSLPEE